MEAAGFKAGWASSLTMSGSLGLRDNNELSWTQVIEILNFICDSTAIPILLDGDTGYGNFNNVRLLVKNLEKVGAAAVCMEDKEFPKKNSFIGGEKQALADIDEFAGKIKASKDTQTDPDFSVIARVEAFIAGWGLSEALKRAEAYHKAGADAIVIHSSSNKPDEVISFKREWGDRCPVVIIPTKYYGTPVEVFEKEKFSAVIWANMTFRSSVKAMQDNIKKLAETRSVISIDDKMVSVGELFRLQGADELEQAEKRYLPAVKNKASALILAASQGADLGTLTHAMPKTLLPIGGKPILDRQVETYNQLGIKDITVVRGFKKEMFKSPGLRYIDNDEYDSTQEVYSLYRGLQNVSNNLIVNYGDVLFKRFIPMNLIESQGDFVIAVDPDWHVSPNKHRYIDFVSCDEPFKKDVFDPQVNLIKAGKDIGNISGEWIGLMKFSEKGVSDLKALLNQLSKKSNFKKYRMADLFNEWLGQKKKISVQYITSDWVDVDDLKDVQRASFF